MDPEQSPKPAAALLPGVTAEAPDPRFSGCKLPGKPNEAFEAECWYECGTKDFVNRENARLVNDANVACPCWICRPCRNCAGVIVRAMRQEGKGVMKEFNTFKSNHTKQWKDKVRAARLLPPEQRREVATSIHAEWTKTVRVRQSNNVVYLTRARFISYYMLCLKRRRQRSGNPSCVFRRATRRQTLTDKCWLLSKKIRRRLGSLRQLKAFRCCERPRPVGRSAAVGRRAR